MDRSAYPLVPDQVHVFFAGDEIPESCERVAILLGPGDETFIHEVQIVDELREEAGKLGANAVQLQTMTDPGTEDPRVSARSGSNSDRDPGAIALWCPDRTGGARPRR
jgi:hypothetical protein